MRILIISNMYPSINDPVYGTFVKTFVSQMDVLNGDRDTHIIVIKGRTNSVWGKISKYISFYIKIIISLLFNKWDIIYVHTITYPIIPIRFALFFRKLPLVFNVHGGDVITHGKIASKLKQCARPILQKAKMIVSPSYFFKDVLIQQFPEIDVNKIFVSPSAGIAKEFYNQNDKVQNDIPHIGFISRIDNGKGWDIFIDALSILRDKGILFNAIIGGRGTAEQDMKNKIDGLSLDKIVDYVGPVPHPKLPDVYNTLDLFIFPTCFEESLGLVGLEAMACGVPVIGSYIGGLKDYIKEGNNGFFFTPGNAKELAEKIVVYLLLSEKEKKQIADNAKETAKKYASESINKELYNHLLSFLQ